jgi:hypothetical protein
LLDTNSNEKLDPSQVFRNATSEQLMKEIGVDIDKFMAFKPAPKPE